MNKDEFHGGVRYATGKVEKAVGDTVNSRDWQVDGVVDQVAGGAQHTYGRAKSIIGEAVESAPELIDEARDRLKDAGERVADVASDTAARAKDAAGKHGKAAARTVQDTPALWAVAALVGGYALGWAIHGRRA